MSSKKLRSCRARTAAACQFASHTRLHFKLSLMFLVSLADGHLRAYRLRTVMRVSLLDSNVAMRSFFKHA